MNGHAPAISRSRVFSMGAAGAGGPADAQVLAEDGTDDRVEFPTTGQAAGAIGKTSVDYSVDFWCKAVTAAGSDTVFGQGTSNYFATFKSFNTTEMRCYIWDGGAAFYTIATFGSGSWETSWHHYALTVKRSGSPYQATGYLDGTGGSPATIDNTADWSVASALFAGCKAAGTEHANVKLASIRIWKSIVLSAANVAKLATAANLNLLPSEISGFDTGNAPDASLVRWYPFRTVTNSTINDASAIIDEGADGSDGTGYNHAGTSSSGIATDIPT